MEHITKPQRKYFDGRVYHRDYFATIDTQEKAYILGFLWGDASYIPSKKTIALALAIKDEQHLRQMANCMGLDEAAVRQHKSSSSSFGVFDYVKIQMSHKTFFECLQKQGFTKKPQRFRQMPAVPKHLMRHFLRGLFDADGSISASGKNLSGTPKQLSLEVSLPHMEAVNWWCRLMSAEIGVEFGTGRDRSIFKVRLGKRSDLRKVYQYFYTDSQIALGRKQTRFHELLNFGGMPPAEDVALIPAA